MGPFPSVQSPHLRANDAGTHYTVFQVRFDDYYRASLTVLVNEKNCRKCPSKYIWLSHTLMVHAFDIDSTSGLTAAHNLARCSQTCYKWLARTVTGLHQQIYPHLDYLSCKNVPDKVSTSNIVQETVIRDCVWDTAAVPEARQVICILMCIYMHAKSLTYSKYHWIDNMIIWQCLWWSNRLQFIDANLCIFGIVYRCGSSVN